MAPCIKLFFGISVVTFLGWNVLSLMPRRKDALYLPEALAISFGLGIGLVSLEMLIFYFLGLKFDLVLIFIPWFLLIGLNLSAHRFYRARMLSGMPLYVKKFTGLENILVLGIALEASYAFLRALIKPIESYDAIAIYAIKSKIFYLAGSIPQEYFSSLANLFPHPDYPLNIPLAQTFIYILIGQFNDQLVKVIFPIYYIGILSLIYCAIRRFAPRLYALLFTFIMATIPQFSAYATNAYLDLVLSFYYLASALLLAKWLMDRDDTASLIVSALMVAMAAWTKNEGLMYCIINVFLMSAFLFAGREPVRKKDIAAVLGYTGILLGISLPWLWIKVTAHILNSDVGGVSINPSNLFSQIYKIVPILYEFQKEFFNPKKWLIIWPMVLVVFILNYRRAFAGVTRRFVALSVALAILGYVFFYMTSHIDIRFFVGKTWARFLIHFLPLVVYWTALVVCDGGEHFKGDK